MKFSLHLLASCLLLSLCSCCDEEHLQALKDRVRTLEEIDARQSEQVIRFDAYRTQIQGEADEDAYIPAGVQVTFDDTNVNIGSGFDVRNSEFVAPIDGVYIFFFSSECIDPTIHCHTEIRRNNQVVSAFQDDTSDRNLAHQTAWFSVLTLNAGDSITVHTQDVINEPYMLYYAHNEIRFYGYLITAV